MTASLLNLSYQELKYPTPNFDWRFCLLVLTVTSTTNVTLGLQQLTVTKPTRVRRAVLSYVLVSCYVLTYTRKVIVSFYCLCASACIGLLTKCVSKRN